MKTKKDFIEILYEGLKESYPDCEDTIKEQFELIEQGKETTNIIGMWIKEEIENYLKNKNGVKDG